MYRQKGGAIEVEWKVFSIIFFDISVRSLVAQKKPGAKCRARSEFRLFYWLMKA
jgi:hypothetical protein